MRLGLPALLIILALPAAVPAQEGGDPAAGQRIFNSQCRACHTIDQGGRNGVGPNLHGAVGRRAAGVQGFRYSQNMQQLAEQGHSWTEEQLRAYLRDPKAVVPRGTMAYAGLRNEQQMNDLLAYLRQQSGG